MEDRPAPAANATVVRSIELLVAGLQTISERFQQVAADPSGRKRLLSTPPGTFALAHCGSLLVPFGGVELRAFEAYLNNFVVQRARERVPAQEQRWHTRSERNKGYVHTVHDLRKYDPRAVKSLRHLGPLAVRATTAESDEGMLRSSGDFNRTRSHLPDADACSAYRLNVWNGYVEWALGELGIFPRIFAAWCWHAEQVRPEASPEASPEADLFLATLVEKWEPLATFVNLAWPRDRDLVNGSMFKSESAARNAVLCFKRVKLNGDFENRCPAENRTTVIAQLVRQLGDISQGAGLVSEDLKPNDLLVRVNPATGQWEGRLSDLEAAGTRGHSTAGMVTGMPPKCALLVNSFSLVTIFACGPTRQTQIAREFVVRALSALERAEVQGDPCAANSRQDQEPTRQPTRTRSESGANGTTTGLYRDAYRNFHRLGGKFKAILNVWMNKHEVAECRQAWNLQDPLNKYGGFREGTWKLPSIKCGSV